MTDLQFQELLTKHPSRSFCLHNGFDGFCYGSPLNPVWIPDERAFDLLSKYETLTKQNPLLDFEETWYLFTLLFADEATALAEETGYQMIGFNKKNECCHGDQGLG